MSNGLGVRPRGEVLGAGRVPRTGITAECARQLVVGVARLLDADVAVATTGAGGPGPQEDRPAGTVFIAVTGDGDGRVREYHVDGDPAEIVAAATARALADLADLVDPPGD
jgi:nicotinamide-nucleotide amidase